MLNLLSIALSLTPVESGLIVVAGLSFLIMFGYSSARGGYQDLIKTTLANDEAIRKKVSKQDR